MKIQTISRSIRAVKSLLFTSFWLIAALGFAEKSPETLSERVSLSSPTTPNTSLPKAIIPDNSVGSRTGIIYKSIDTHGRVTYSDQPNPDALQEEQINFPEYSPMVDSEKAKVKFDKMVATTKRLQEDRRVREEQRRQHLPRIDQTTPAPYPQVIVQSHSHHRNPYNRYKLAAIHSPYYLPYSLYRGYNKSNQYSPIRVNIRGGNSKFSYGFDYNTRHRAFHTKVPYKARLNPGK